MEIALSNFTTGSVAIGCLYAIALIIEMLMNENMNIQVTKLALLMMLFASELIILVLEVRLNENFQSTVFLIIIIVSSIFRCSIRIGRFQGAAIQMEYIKKIYLVEDYKDDDAEIE